MRRSNDLTPQTDMVMTPLIRHDHIRLCDSRKVTR